MDHILTQIHNPMMLECVLRFMKVEELGSVEVIVSYLREVELVSRLVYLLKPDKSEAVRSRFHVQPIINRYIQLLPRVS